MATDEKRRSPFTAAQLQAAGRIFVDLLVRQLLDDLQNPSSVPPRRRPRRARRERAPAPNRRRPPVPGRRAPPGRRR